MKLSVVIPTYRSESNLPLLTERLATVMANNNFDHEIIFVDDDSPDNTLKILRNASLQNPNIKAVSLSRNFGQQAAISAGLKSCSGDFVIIMDDDLQDPPELIPELVKKEQEGFDVVYAIRENRKESLFKRIGYRFFYSLLAFISDIKIPQGAGDFCIMSKRVVNLLNNMTEKERFVRGLRAWVGFKQAGIKYDRGQRHSGSPAYTLPKILKLSSDGWLSFSNKPLVFSFWIGVALISLSIILFFVFLFNLIAEISLLNSLFQHLNFTSWILILASGIQLISIGILGEYVGRIYNEAKDRPLYIVKETIGFENK